MRIEEWVMARKLYKEMTHSDRRLEKSDENGDPKRRGKNSKNGEGGGRENGLPQLA